MELSGRTVVVTGAGSGLGQATAVRLAGQGARVALLDMSAERVDALAAELGGEAFGFGVDVTKSEAVEQAIRAVLDRFGAIHVCLNAAGIATPGVITNGTTPLPIEAFRRVIEVNLIGLFDVMRHCVTAMAANEPLDGERGVVINVSSGAWSQGQRGQAAYAASKAGVVGLTLPTARDLARFGIRVVAIAQACSRPRWRRPVGEGARRTGTDHPQSAPPRASPGVRRARPAHHRKPVLQRHHRRSRRRRRMA